MGTFNYEKGKVVAQVFEGDKPTKNYAIHCPACNELHVFDERWTFNNDFYKPTFRASMLVHGDESTRKETNGRYGHRCHSFVTDGKIKYLSDCTHDMKNKEVDLPPF